MLCGVVQVSGRVLLVPGDFGPQELHPVLRRLEDQRVLAQVGPAPDLPGGLLSLPAEQIRALDEERLDGAEHEPITLAVSIGTGAAAAVHAATADTAGAVILIDPSPGAILAHWPDAAAVVPVDHQLGRQTAERLKTFDEAQLAAGDWTPEVVDVVAGAFTGDPTRVAQAESAKDYLLSRVNLARVQPGEADIASADWVQPLLGWEGSPVQIWFGEPHHRLAQHLEQHTRLHIVRQPWPERAWLAEPDAVANAVVQQLPR